LSIHLKDVNSGLHRDAFWAKHMVQPGPTSWCHMDKTRLRMARDIYKDPQVTQLIWLSGDSIPLKPFKQVYAAYAHSQHSQFCVDEQHNRSEMWAVWNRRHGMLFSDHEAEMRSLFKGVFLCEDEDLYLNAMRKMGLDEEMEKVCPMWTNWGPKKGFMYNQAGERLRGPGCGEKKNYNPMGGEPAHPNTFMSVCAKGIEELVQDHRAFFARKFDKTARVVETGEHLGEYLKKLL